jgi:hypothetical protein
VSAVVATLEHCQNCSWLSDGVCPAAAAGAEEVGDPDGALAALAPGASAADELGAGELRALALGVVPGGTFVFGAVAVAVGAAAFGTVMVAAATVGAAALGVCPGAIALGVAPGGKGVAPGMADGVALGADGPGDDPGCGSVCAAAV